MNTVHICGNIGAEPDFMLFDNGTKKVTFSVALNQFGKDGKQKETIWIPCQAWGPVYDRLLKCKEKAALVGCKINITGTFAQNSWKDQATGQKRTKLLVKVMSFELLPRTKDDPAAAAESNDDEAPADTQAIAS